MLLNEFVLVLSIICWLSVYISILASPDNHADMINLSSKRKIKQCFYRQVICVMELEKLGCPLTFSRIYGTGNLD